MKTSSLLRLRTLVAVAAMLVQCAPARGIDWHRLDPWRGNQRPRQTEREYSPPPPQQQQQQQPTEAPTPTQAPAPTLSPEEIAAQQRQAEAIEENNQGNNAFVKRDWGAAELCYERSLRIHPGDPVVVQNLANAQNQQGVDAYRKADYATALHDFQRALATDPNNRWVRKNIENAQRQIEEARAQTLRAAEQRRQDKVAADAIQQSIAAYEQTLGSAAAVEGFEFAYRTVPRTLIPDYTYRPPANVAEARERIASLDAQIAATQRQLQSLGFSQRADDFNRLGELSAEQMKEVRKHVNSLVGDLARSGGEEALLKSFEHIRPDQMGALLRRMDHLGMKDSRVFHALQGFAGNTPRAQLAENAKFLVKYIDDGCDLKEGADGFYDGKKQELGMTLISVMTGSSIGVALYDGADAGATLYLLTHDQQRLEKVTESELGNLKTTTARMKRIVDERNDLRRDLQGLQANERP